MRRPLHPPAQGYYDAESLWSGRLLGNIEINVKNNNEMSKKERL